MNKATYPNVIDQSDTSIQQDVALTTHPPISRTHLVWLTYGISGTLLFLMIYLLEGVTRPGYNAWADTISALSHGPEGWIQQLNFALCGISVLWSAFVWRKVLVGGKCATWYPIIRGIEGGGLVAIAFFTQDPLHTVFLVIIVEAMTIGLFIIARRFWKQPLWRGWVVFSVAYGLLPVVLMPLFGLALHTQEGMLVGYTGLIERIATNADTIWSLVLLVHLWRHRSKGI